MVFATVPAAPPTEKNHRATSWPPPISANVPYVVASRLSASAFCRVLEAALSMGRLLRWAGRAVNEDRRHGSPDELIGHTPQQQPLEAAPTVRGQGDEVARLRRGPLQNGLDRVPGDDDPRPDWHPLLSYPRGDVLQVRLRLRLLRRPARRA